MNQENNQMSTFDEFYDDLVSAPVDPTAGDDHPCARCKGRFEPSALNDCGDEVICDGCAAEEVKAQDLEGGSR